MKKPTQQEGPQQSPQQQPVEYTKREAAKEVRNVLSEIYTRQVGDYITQTWTPRYQRGTATRQKTLPDGTTITIKFQKRLGPHPGVDPNDILQLLYGQTPTREQFAHIAAHLGIPEGLSRQEHEAVVMGLHTGNLEPFFHAWEHLGPRLLLDVECNTFVTGWWLRLLDPAASAQEREGAKNALGRLCETLKGPGRGRYEELTTAEKQQTKNSATSRSKAKARRVKKFEKYKQIFGDAKQARNQVLMEFDQSTRIKDLHRKALIRRELDKELQRRVVAEG